MKKEHKNALIGFFIGIALFLLIFGIAGKVKAPDCYEKEDFLIYQFVNDSGVLFMVTTTDTYFFKGENQTRADLEDGDKIKINLCYKRSRRL